MKTGENTMKKAMKSLIAITAITFLASASHASILVQWGTSGGAETDIVGSDQEVSNVMQSTWDGDLLTPTPGASYYPNAGSVRSPNVYGAGSRGNEEITVKDDAAGDYMDLWHGVGVNGNWKGMLAWKQNDFLTGGILSGFSAEIKGLINRDDDGEIRWLVEEGGQWFVSSQTYSYDSAGYAVYSASAQSVTWNAFTPFSSGVSSIGAGASPTLGVENIGWVGLYFDVDATGGHQFAGLDIRHFEVQAVVPEPATLVLLGAGLGVIMMARRRKGWK